MHHIQSARAGLGVVLLGAGSISYGLATNSVTSSFNPMLFVATPLFVSCVLASYKLFEITDELMPRSVDDLFVTLFTCSALLVIVLSGCGAVIRWIDTFDNHLSGVMILQWLAKALIVVGAFVIPIGFALAFVQIFLALLNLARRTPKELLS